MAARRAAAKRAERKRGTARKRLVPAAQARGLAGRELSLELGATEVAPLVRCAGAGRGRMTHLRARVIVSGRVQGVWFRESTRRRAEELGVGGWVRNLPDGRVEALFEGVAEGVRAALAFVRQGPPLARVREVWVEEECYVEPAPGPHRFEIRAGTC